MGVKCPACKYGSFKDRDSVIKHCRHYAEIGGIIHIMELLIFEYGYTRDELDDMVIDDLYKIAKKEGIYKNGV